MNDEPAAPAADEEAPAGPDVPGLDDLLAWLAERTPAVARAKIAAYVVKRINDEVIDPAIVYAWQHRAAQAELRDLAAATGLNIARITWALRRHPRSDT